MKSIKRLLARSSQNSVLYQLEINFEGLGSTTFKNVPMAQAVEADTCFYIKNYQAVIGKDRLDLTSDPPPDLAIEIDITNRTRLDNYLLLKGSRTLALY